MPDFAFQQLGENVFVCTSREHTFGTDALLLADFAAPKARMTACDLGTGCGIIPLFWAARGTRPERIWGIDVQPQAVRQFQLGLERSGESLNTEEIYPLLGDLRNLPRELPRGRFDLVTCNPPYQTGAGLRPQTSAGAIARHEVLCTAADVCAAGARLLKSGGRLCLCQKPERLTDLLCAMRAAGVEPKRLRFVAKEAESPPWLFLLEGRRNGRPGLRVQNTLAVYREGRYSPEMRRIYGPAFGEEE